MKAGDVFRFSGIADIHVWMIISDPRRDASKVLMVNFTSWEPHLDQACILDIGAHPFIVQRTVVNFARAKLVTDTQLEWLRTHGRLQLLDLLPATLLTKIRAAAMQSLTLPLELADVLIDQELVE